MLFDPKGFMTHRLINTALYFSFYFMPSAQVHEQKSWTVSDAHRTQICQIRESEQDSREARQQEFSPNHLILFLHYHHIIPYVYIFFNSNKDNVSLAFSDCSKTSQFSQLQYGGRWRLGFPKRFVPHGFCVHAEMVQVDETKFLRGVYGAF